MWRAVSKGAHERGKEVMDMIKIKLHTKLSGEEHERLDDKIRDLFIEEGITAEIENTSTGNITWARPRGTKARLIVESARNTG